MDPDYPTIEYCGTYYLYYVLVGTEEHLHMPLCPNSARLLLFQSFASSPPPKKQLCKAPAYFVLCTIWLQVAPYFLPLKMLMSTTGNKCSAAAYRRTALLTPTILYDLQDAEPSMVIDFSLTAEQVPVASSQQTNDQPHVVHQPPFYQHMFLPLDR
jgi:hypothetical protein